MKIHDMVARIRFASFPNHTKYAKNKEISKYT